MAERKCQIDTGFEAKKSWSKNRKISKVVCEGNLDLNLEDHSARTCLLLYILPNAGFPQTLQPPNFVEKR